MLYFLDFVGNCVLATSKQYQTITLGVSEQKACGIPLTIHDGLPGFSLQTWQLLGDAQFSDMPTYHIVSYIYIHHHTPVYPHYITMKNPLWLVLEPIEVGYSKSLRSHHTLQHYNIIYSISTPLHVYI